MFIHIAPIINSLFTLLTRRLTNYFCSWTQYWFVVMFLPYYLIMSSTTYHYRSTLQHGDNLRGPRSGSREPRGQNTGRARGTLNHSGYPRPSGSFISTGADDRISSNVNQIGNIDDRTANYSKKFFASKFFTLQPIFNVFGAIINITTVPRISKPFDDYITCNQSRCKICPLVDRSVSIKNSNLRTRFTKNNYGLSCNAKNIIYCITCNNCNLQYVGLTTQSFKQRISQHIYDIKKGTKQTILVDHFHGTNCCSLDISVTILDRDDSANLREREYQWMKILGTISPFGLNNNLKYVGNVGNFTNYEFNDNANDINKFLTFKLNRGRKSRGRRKRSSHVVNYDDIYKWRCAISTNDINSTCSLISLLNNMNKRTFQKAVHIAANSNKDYFIKLTTAINIILKRSPNIHKKFDTNSPKYTFRIPFPIPNLEKLNFPRILRQTAKYLLSQNNLDFEFRVSYTLNPPISLHIFNYTKLLRDLNLDNLLHIIRQPCTCFGSTHIITADTNVLNCRLCSDILKRGTKFRNPTNCTKDDYINICTSEIDKIISRIPCLVTHKAEFLSIMSDKLDHLLEKKNIRFEYSRPSVNPAFHHKNFMFLPVDKASNNYGIVCRKHWLLVMATEFGIKFNNAHNTLEVNGNDTYKRVSIIPELLVNNIVDTSCSFEISVPEQSKKLPIIYAIPKLHKSPPKFRFISASTSVVTEPISKLLMRVLAGMKSHFIAYCKQIHKRTGNYAYISIVNNSKLLDYLAANKDKSCSIQTLDFSTLYTKLPHHKIIDCLCRLFTILFNNGKKYLNVPNNPYRKPFYSHDKLNKSSINSLTIYDCSTILKTVLSESYVLFCGIVFQQIKGVPMGGNASPLIADLTLSVMEYEAFKELNFSLRFGNLFLARYVDDIIAINVQYHNWTDYIYGNDIEVTIDTAINSKISYLDLEINEDNSDHSLYNKMDKFNFEVIRATNAMSVQPTNMVKGILVSHLIRFSRVCSSLDTFRSNVIRLFQSYLKLGYSIELISRSSSNFLHKYSHPLCAKYRLGCVDRVRILFISIISASLL